MELCTTQGLSTPPPLKPHRFQANPIRSLHLNQSTHFLGLLSRSSTLLRATFDEKSSESNKYSKDGTDFVSTLEDVPFVDNDVTLDKAPPVDQSLYNESTELESPQDQTSSDDDPMQPLSEFLAKLNIQLDSEDSPTILLYGGGALLAVWLLSAVIGSIDSIPVFPKLMEVVGLGYSVWFTTRYLLFKKNRQELFSKIEELKIEILGSSDN